MKVIIIDDDTDLENYGYGLPGEDFVFTKSDANSKRKLYDVAVEVKHKIQLILTRNEAEEIILFITVFLECSDKDFQWLQSQSGIALLKFLRMIGVEQHVVLISPYEALNLVKQSPGNLIVISPGVTITTVYSDFGCFTAARLKEIAEEKFDAALSPYLLADFSLPEDERHNWANWWGIDRLWNIHRRIEKKRYLEQTERWNLPDYPVALKKKIKELKNYQALFLYGHKDTLVDESLLMIKQEKSETEKDIAFLNKKKIQIEEAITFFSELKTGTESHLLKHIHSLENLKQINAYDNSLLVKSILNNILTPAESYKLISDIKSFEQSIEVRKDIIDNIFVGKIKSSEKKVVNLLQSVRGLYQQANDRLDAFINTAKSKINGLAIDTLRAELAQRKPRILYIDDQAGEGWSNIFQQVIFSEEQPNVENYELPGFFKVIQPKATDKIDPDYFNSYISQIISQIKPALILLDLRLNRETGIRTEVEYLSGAIILKEIRRRFPGIPVLMTTASNKSWSYEELQRLGCDAFWTKEGIDTTMTESDSVKNYFRFAELVNILTGDEYAYLNWLSEKIKIIYERESQWWWENYKYAFEGKVDRIAVVDILNDTLFILRQYLRNLIVHKFDNNHLSNWLLPSLMIHNLGKVPELIYNTWSIKYMYDVTAQHLFLIRNCASHIVQNEEKRTAKNFNLLDAVDFIKRVTNYLSLEKTPPIADIKDIPAEKLQLSRAEILKNIEVTKNRKR